MAKVTVYIPEPKEVYDPSSQRQLLEALNTLQNQLNFKDSLANTQSLILISLQKKLDSIETEFNQAKHKCTTECYPFIIQLNTTNKQLYSKVDSLNAEIGFLDSLIETNKKLSKQLGSY